MRPLAAVLLGSEAKGRPDMANLRYVHRVLDAVQVYEALTRAGLVAAIDPWGHKAQQPEQGHGRWQVNGEKFEVHPGYLSPRSKTPDIIIIQGRKGWSATELDAAEQAIRTCK